MFGPKISTVFRSRWNALLWAAGVMATAYCTVPSQDQTPADKAQLQATEQALKQVAAVGANGWKLDGNKDGGGD